MSVIVSCLQCQTKFYAPANALGQLVKCGDCGQEFVLSSRVPEQEFELLPKKACLQCGEGHSGLKGLCNDCLVKADLLDAPPPRRRIESGSSVSWPRVGCGGLAATYAGFAMVRSMTGPKKRYNNQAYQAGRETGAAIGFIILFVVLIVGLYQVGRGISR